MLRPTHTCVLKNNNKKKKNSRQVGVWRHFKMFCAVSTWRNIFLFSSARRQSWWSTDEYNHCLSNTVEIVLLWIVFNTVTVVTDQWLVCTHCDILVTCLEAKGQYCIYPAMKKIFSPAARYFFMYDKLIIRHCLASVECEHS